MATQSERSGLNFSFRTRLLLSVGALVLLTGAIVLAVADHSTRASTNTLVDSLFREVSNHAATQTKDFVLQAAPVVTSLEELAAHGLELDDLDKLAPQLLAFLRGNPGLTWVLYGSATGDYAGATRLPDGRLHLERTRMTNGKSHFTEYEVADDGSLNVVVEDDNRGYDPRVRPFYKLAVEQGRLAWTPPYVFFSSGLPGISCVAPVKSPTGEVRGVFSVEFDLRALSEFAAAQNVSEHSSVFLFTPDQTLLAHPNQREQHGQGKKGGGQLLTLADTGDPLVDAFREHLSPELLSGTGDNAYHFFQFNHDGVGYLASTTVFQVGDGQPWVVGAVAPESDFLASVWHTRWLALGAAAAALVLAMLAAAVLARHISQPVQALIGLMQRVGGGDLEARANLTGGREFRDLSAALNRMIGELRERLQLRNSLQLAMDVQKSLLPARSPASPLLDIAGRSKYCDETGGDYYDFIEVPTLPQPALLVAVGDVMGHGLPSALVMATARAALRTSALREQRLADLLTRTNHVLAADNRHDRFMTLSLLLIDPQSRVVRWASGGHDPAVVFDPATDTFRTLEGGGMPLGLVADIEYQEFTSPPLPPNCVIVIGTDGVWEMVNERDELYGKERMQAVVQKYHTRPAQEIAALLEADLASFRGARNPADDVTFVIVKLLSPATKE